MVGTDAYADFLYTYRSVLANNKCHTLDRFNLKSYLDTCANTQMENVEIVIKQRFNFTYWPYMNANPENKVRECIEEAFIDSYKNLMTHATHLVSTLAVLLAASTAFL